MLFLPLAMIPALRGGDSGGGALHLLGLVGEVVWELVLGTQVPPGLLKWPLSLRPLYPSWRQACWSPPPFLRFPWLPS